MKVKVLSASAIDLIPEHDADEALLAIWRFQQARLCGTHYRDASIVSISVCFQDEQQKNRLKTPDKKA